MTTTNTLAYTNYRIDEFGNRVGEHRNSEDMIRAADLDWDVQLADLSAHVPDGPDAMRRVEVPGKFATVRSDTSEVLGVVGSKYEPLQNREAFSFLDNLLMDGIVKYETAGYFDRGRKVWALASMQGLDFSVNGDDIQKPYLFLTTSHDGSSSIQINPTVIRVVCQNTYAMAIAEGRRNTGESFVIRHTSSMNERLRLAANAIEVSSKNIEQTKAAVSKMSSAKITPSEAADFIAKMLPFEFKGSESYDSGRSGAAFSRTTQNLREEFNIGGATWWSAYNAITGWVDHQQSRNGGNDRERQESQMKATILPSGAGSKIKSAAFREALAHSA